MPEALHPEDEPIRSSESDLEEFKDSRIWHDFKAFLEEREEDIMRQMRDPSLDVQELRFLQGGLEHVQDMKDLPDKLINELEAINNG